MTRAGVIAVAGYCALSACANGQAIRDGARAGSAIPVTLEALEENPWAFEDKWVAVEGWAEAQRNCCETLYDTPDTWDDAKPYHEFHKAHFSRAGKRVRISHEYNRRHVSVVAKIDLTCVRANAWLQSQARDGQIIMIQGFCHTSDSPGLSQPKIKIIE